MPTFELTLVGYHADDDHTDHLIKWISGDSIQDVSVWITHHGLWAYVKELRDMGQDANHYRFDDGVDVLLAADKGDHEHAVEITPSIWQITRAAFSAEAWMKESLAATGVPA